MNSPTYYSVTGNGKWTDIAKPASYYVSRGIDVTDSRVDSELAAGIKTLWLNGHNVGKLFPTQAGQIAHLRAKGLI